MKTPLFRSNHKRKEPTCNYDQDLPDTLVEDTIYRTQRKYIIKKRSVRLRVNSQYNK